MVLCSNDREPSLELQEETRCLFVIVGPFSAVLSQLWGRSPDPDCHLQDTARLSGSGLRLSNGAKTLGHPALPEGELHPGNRLARWRLGSGEHLAVMAQKLLIALLCSSQTSFDPCSLHIG